MSSSVLNHIPRQLPRVYQIHHHCHINPHQTISTLTLLRCLLKQKVHLACEHPQHPHSILLSLILPALRNKSRSRSLHQFGWCLAIHAPHLHSTHHASTNKIPHHSPSSPIPNPSHHNQSTPPLPSIPIKPRAPCPTPNIPPSPPHRSEAPLLSCRPAYRCLHRTLQIFCCT